MELSSARPLPTRAGTRNSIQFYTESTGLCGAGRTTGTTQIQFTWSTRKLVISALLSVPTLQIFKGLDLQMDDEAVIVWFFMMGSSRREQYFIWRPTCSGLLSSHLLLSLGYDWRFK